MPQANRLKLPSAPVRRQLEGRVLWNDARNAAEAHFFSFGYSGRGTKELLQILSEQGVRTLLDVRQNAVSMYRPDLSKRNLERLVKQRGMLYAHSPDLGVPRDIRAKAIEAGTRDVIWEWYDRYVATVYLANLHTFFNAFEHRVALMCAEIDPRECHRHRLFLALESMGLKGFEL